MYEDQYAEFICGHWGLEGFKRAGGQGFPSPTMSVVSGYY